MVPRPGDPRGVRRQDGTPLEVLGKTAPAELNAALADVCGLLE